MHSVAIAPDDASVVWASGTTRGSNVILSLDGGASWVHRGPDDWTWIGKILVDPVDPSTVFALQWPHDRIYRTRDLGATWEVVRLPFSAALLTERMTLDPQSGRLWISHWENGIFWSDDSGETFDELELPPGFVGGGVEPLPDGKVVFWDFEGSGSRVFLGGPDRTWQEVTPERPTLVHSPSVARDGTIWLGSERGLLRRRPGDEGWTRIEESWPGPPPVESIVETEEGTYLASYGRGPYGASPDGRSWSRVDETSFEGTWIRELSMDGFGRPLASTRHGLRRREHDGTWLTLTATYWDVEQAFGSRPGSPRIWARRWLSRPLYSDDDGVTWNVAEVTGSGGRLGVAPTDPRFLYYQPIPADEFWLSSDGGDSWRLRHDDLARGIEDLQISPGDPLEVWTAGQPGIHYSRDGGRSWAAAFETFDGRPHGAFSVALDPGRPGRVLSGWKGRVLVSNDRGRTWSVLGSGLPPNAFVYELHISREALFAGTQRGLWRLPRRADEPGADLLLDGFETGDASAWSSESPAARSDAGCTGPPTS